MKKPLLLIFIVLLVDQALKFWVKTNMYLGQEYKILGNWFIIHFTENNGMAFGLELSGAAGKFLLSTFRIIVVIGIIYLLVKLVRTKAHPLFITAMSLITAGAIGNILDSVFYGILFSSSEFQVAKIFPPEGGYSSFLHGKVVDMLYFPIIETHYPQWFPLWKGEPFVFFRPVFNIADSAISTGVFIILIFQKRIFHKEKQEINDPENNSAATESNQASLQ